MIHFNYRWSPPWNGFNHYNVGSLFEKTTIGVVNLCPTIDSVNCFDSPGKFERPIALLVKMYDPFAFFQSFSISKKYPFNLIEIERILNGNWIEIELNEK